PEDGGPDATTDATDTTPPTDMTDAIDPSQVTVQGYLASNPINAVGEAATGTDVDTIFNQLGMELVDALGPVPFSTAPIDTPCPVTNCADSICEFSCDAIGLDAVDFYLLGVARDTRAADPVIVPSLCGLGSPEKLMTAAEAGMPATTNNYVVTQDTVD